MSANYFQALRLRNKSQKDEVNGMSRGARDRGSEGEGHFGSKHLQVESSFLPPDPQPGPSTGTLYSPTREAASKELDIPAPSQEFPWKIAWKQLPEPRGGRHGHLYVLVPLLHPLAVSPTKRKWHHSLSAETGCLGS